MAIRRYVPVATLLVALLAALAAASPAAAAKKTQTIKFESTPPSPALVGEKTYVVKASASSGLPVSLSLIHS